MAVSNVWNANNGWKTQGGELQPLNALLHCRTVVESQNSVATGLLTHVEGEWFEVEINEFDSFQLGEKVKLTVYSPVGMQTFFSSVFAKYEGAIAVIQPPEVKKRYEEKRSHPRVDVEGSVRIIAGFDQAGGSLELAEPMDAVVRNISITGIGFEVPDLPIVRQFAKLVVMVEIGFAFQCELDIVRKDPQDEGIRIGALMTLAEQDMMRSLRAFILQQQVSQKVQSRKAEDKRKLFSRP